MITNRIHFFSFLYLSVCLCLLSSCSEETKKDSYQKIPVKTVANVFVSDKQIPDAHFLGDKACKECHQNEYEKWQGSHHDKSMQIATRETILADFKGESYTSQGVYSRFYSKGGDFYVNTEGPDGNNHDYKIEYVFGLTPLQQYIVKFPNGHYQCLRTAWDVNKKKWYDLYPDFKVVHSEWLHWSRGGLNWNNMCADCHSTNVRKNYTQKDHSYDTEFALINVSCEACHGPGKDHVSAVNKLGENYRDTGTMKMTMNTPPKELVDQCARCHMRREQISDNYNFEGTMLDHYYPQLITPNIYHEDGQILDEDYVYGSFVQSKMYHNNVTCTNCHDPHTMERKFEGNKLCAQCHVPEVFDTEKHHYHPKGSEGAQCVNCHMPGKHYMGIDFRRDHSFRIPRPDLSVKYGTPNACTGCHKEKTDEWAESVVLERYGERDYIHFSDYLVPGLTRAPNALESLTTLAKSQDMPEIARASAIKEMGNYRNQVTVNDLLHFLNDTSALVRASSIDALNEMSNPEYLTSFLPMLSDPKRSVRVKAFSALAAMDENSIPQKHKKAYQITKKEYFKHLGVTADFVGGRINKANYILKKGNLQAAIKGYESALELDNINNIVRTNLSNLYYQNKQFDKAEEAFKTIISQEPEYGATYYSYGLLLAELKRTPEAIQQMEKATKYLPKNTRIYYNLSLLYDSLHNTGMGEKTILRGLQEVPNNESLLYLLAYHYAQNNAPEKAKNIALKLVELFPENPQYFQFLQQLNQQ